MLRHAVLIALALTLTPVLAFDAGQNGDRGNAAAVTADSGAFLTLTNLAPSPAAPVVLNTGNDFEENVLSAGNAYTATTTLQATLLNDEEGRFKISNPTATLAPGAEHTFKIEDQASRHSRGCFALTLRVDAYLGGTGSARAGHATIDRVVHVQVGNRC